MLSLNKTEKRPQAAIRAVACLLFAACALFPAMPARAASSYGDLQKQLQQAQQQQKALQSQIAGNKATQAQVKQQLAAVETASSILSQQIAQLNGRAADNARQIAATDGKIAVTQADIAATDRQIAATQASIEADDALYRQRVATLFETGRVSYLELLFSAKTPAQFFARYEIIAQIQQHDIDLIARLKNEKSAVVSQRAALSAQQASLSAQHAQLSAQQNTLAASQREYQSKQDEFNSQSDVKTALYKQLKGQQNALEAQNGQMEQTEAALRKQMREALAAAAAAASGGAHGTGALMWPVNGPITCGFGYRVNPYTGASGDFHDGIDIGAPLGAPIRAADSGTVRYDIPGLAAGNMTAVYGYNYLFILHGNGMVTFYGHCSGRAVPDGASVQKGRVVAYVGSEGYSTGPHLHFGVYVNGRALNPTKYL